MGFIINNLSGKSRCFGLMFMLILAAYSVMMIRYGVLEIAASFAGK
jgi:hypothetical protein